MRRDEFQSMALAELDAVYRFARFLTRSEAAAEDLVQDVYARAFRPASISSFDPRGSGMRAWLMTIARTSFYGQLQHRQAGQRALERLARDMEVAPEAIEAPDAAAADGIDWSTAGPALQAVLDTLSAQLRDVLWLWAVEGMKYREIAEALAVPMGTVMSRLHRARAAAARAIVADAALAAELARAHGAREAAVPASMPARRRP